MSTAIVVALISGAVSLAAAAISLLSARSVARLNSELEERRRARTKEEQAAELRARYRDPLLGAAFDLQSRLYNIVAKDFLVRYCGEQDQTSRTYAVENTLYVLAEYGWVEIVRREIRFLDLGEARASSLLRRFHGDVRRRRRFSSSRSSAAASARAPVGGFRVRAQYSTATAQDATWDTFDRSDGTFTRVTRGRVVVRDLNHDRRVVLRAGGRHLARP
jgi:hypothetical protein